MVAELELNYPPASQDTPEDQRIDIQALLENLDILQDVHLDHLDRLVHLLHDRLLLDLDQENDLHDEKSIITVSLHLHENITKMVDADIGPGVQDR